MPEPTPLPAPLLLELLVPQTETFLVEGLYIGLLSRHRPPTEVREWFDDKHVREMLHTHVKRKNKSPDYLTAIILCMAGLLEGTQVRLTPTIWISTGDTRSKSSIKNSISNATYLNKFLAKFQMREPHVTAASDGSTFQCYSTIGGLILVDDDLFAITTAHAITKHGIPDPRHVVMDETDDPLILRGSHLREWVPSPFPNTFAYLGDAYVRGTKVDKPVVDAADFALVEPQSFPKLGNRYQVEGWSDFETVSGHTPTAELSSGDVTICTNDYRVPMKGYMVEGDAPIIVGGVMMLTRMIEVTMPAAPGLSGSWVVRGEELCGVVYAGNASIPYLYIIPAETMLENVKKLLGSGTVRVATTQNISEWKLRHTPDIHTWKSLADESPSPHVETKAPQPLEDTSFYEMYQVGTMVRIKSFFADLTVESQEMYTVWDASRDRQGNAQYTLQKSDGSLVDGGREYSRNELTFVVTLERAINVSLPYTRELHSSATMYNHPDTQQILTRLVNDGTPQEIAEEGLRICRVNADLRAELDLTRRHAAAATAALARSGPALAQRGAVSASMAASTSSTAGTIPILKSNTAVPTSTIPATPPQGQPRAIKALKNKIAVMEDALAEMRNEAPKMRECMAWMWDIIGKERINHVPKQLKDMYHETMVVDLVDWQPNGRVKGGKGKDDLKNTKGKEEVKVKKERASAADNVLAGVKRRGVSPLGKDAKKIKFEQREV
ncbi:hypothetical protein J4E82_010196 [Alternaria postmessia]|uniref:uncharacterized protein n=1 Tax=Alternaria postmessia TaxID=1187938 RepID=UPI00222529CE|nr:uncharacterized protein J4E82_010196 [Alternaria postmessia]KAI5369001.1 hypothetical protein J4E82_010196 [Alternaria postmessia]